MTDDASAATLVAAYLTAIVLAGVAIGWALTVLFRRWMRRGTRP